MLWACGAQQSQLRFQRSIERSWKAGFARRQHCKVSPSALSDKQIRRGDFGSVAELTRAIRQFITAYNSDPKPFVWTATAQSIVDKVSRCKATMEKLH